MIIGNFSYDQEADLYRGQIRTLTLHRTEIEFRPQKRASDREPDYRVFGTTEHGDVEFGAAWERRSDRGQEYLSVLLDDPSFGRAMSAALFIDREKGSANLVWSRPSQQAPVPEPKAKTSRKATRGPAHG